MTKPHTLAILLVEDSDEDFYTIKRGVKSLGLPISLSRFSTVDDALNDLRSKVSSVGASQLPHLVLLDLNLPGRNGVELLREIKQSKDFALLPTVVLTTSAYSADVEECYREGASGYIQKSANLEDFYAALRVLHAYWSQTVILPVRENVI